MALALVEKTLDTSLFSQVVSCKEGTLPVRAYESGGSLVFQVYEDSSNGDGPGFRVWVASATDSEDTSRFDPAWFVGSATVSAKSYKVYAQPLEAKEAEDFKPGSFLGAWDGDVGYSVGDEVTYLDILYIARNSIAPARPAGSGTNPATDTANWDVVLDSNVGANTVGNTQLSDMAGDTIKGRATTSGDPQDLTPTQVRTMLNVEDGAAADQAWGDITGTLSNQTDLQTALDGKAASSHTHVLADVTDSGALAALDTVGSAQIDDEAVTNAKLAHVATDTIKGRDTAGTGDVEDLTPAQVRTILNVEDGATADENLAAANQTLIANRTIDDGNNGYLFFVDLEDTGKKSQILMNPGNPNVLVQANDGAGNICAYTVGSANIDLQFTGTADLRIDGAPGTDGQVLTSTGTGTAPAWETPVEAGNFGEWAFTHFYSANANANGPYNAGATLGATTGSAGVAAIYTRPGVITIRSATVVDSAYSWATAAFDRIVNVAGLAWCGVFRLPTATARQVKMGFYDSQFSFSGSADVDGAYLQIDASNVATPTCKSNSTSTTGSTFTMSDDTWYYVDIWFETTSSVRFRVRSLDDATSHLDVDITTNIPTGTGRRFGAGIVSGDGSVTAQNCLFLDYMGHGMHPYSDGRRFVST